MIKEKSDIILSLQGNVSSSLFSPLANGYLKTKTNEYEINKNCSLDYDLSRNTHIIHTCVDVQHGYKHFPNLFVIHFKRSPYHSAVCAFFNKKRKP